MKLEAKSFEIKKRIRSSREKKGEAMELVIKFKVHEILI